MPELRNKTHYLMMVNAKESIKDKVTGCYQTQEPKMEKTLSEPCTHKQETKQKQRKPKTQKTKKEGSSMTKTERKAKFNEHKRTLKEV